MLTADCVDRTDFLGDIAFGGGFELMADGGDPHGIWSIFESGMRCVYLRYDTTSIHQGWCTVLGCS